MKHRLLAGLLAASVGTAACTPGARKTATLATGVVVATAGVALAATADDQPECGTFCISIGPDASALAAALVVTGLAIVLVGALAPWSPPPGATAPVPPPPAGHDRSDRAVPVAGADPPTWRLAERARTAALRFDCAATDTLYAAVRDRDPAYAEAVAASGALAPCR